MDGRKLLTKDEIFLALMQPIMRRPESPIDRARRYSWLLKHGKSIDVGLTVREVAEKLDEKTGKVYRYLKLLRLSTEVQKQVHEGRISMTEALRNEIPQQVWQESWVGAGPDNLISKESLR